MSYLIGTLQLLIILSIIKQWIILSVILHKSPSNPHLLLNQLNMDSNLFFHDNVPIFNNKKETINYETNHNNNNKKIHSEHSIIYQDTETLNHKNNNHNLFISLLDKEKSTKDNYPIFLFHGIGTSGKKMEKLKDKILLLTPGKNRIIHLMNVFNKVSSDKSLWKQIRLYISTIRELIAIHPNSYENGYHFIGHSHGALIARAIIETMYDHRVHTYISLAGPQNGIYYSYNHIHLLLSYLKMLPEPLFRNILKNLKYKSIHDVITDFAYHPIAQKITSIANFWRVITFKNGKNDHLFTKNNNFLPIINNLCTEFTENNKIIKTNMDLNPLYCLEDDEDFKLLKSTKNNRKYNFLRVRKVVALYSEQDKVISPPISAGFGYFKNDQDENNNNWETIPIENTKEFRSNTYGLRQLKERKRLVIKNIPNVSHACWIMDVYNCDHDDVFHRYIRPYIK